MNILIAQFSHIIPSTKIFDKYLRNAFKGQKKIDLVVLGEYVANKFFKEYRTKSTLKREFEANKKYFLGLAKKYKTTIVAPVIEWEGGKIYKSILVASNSGNSVLGMQFRTCENFRTSTDFYLVESPKISTNTKATPQSLPLRFCETQNLSENQTKNAESSKKNLSLRDSAKQNRGNPQICHSEPKAKNLKNNQNRDSSVASLPQNDNIKKAQNDKVGEFAESSLDSAISTQKDDEFANLLIYRAKKLMSFPHWDEASFFDNTQKAQEPLIFSVGGFRVGVIFGWEAHFDEIMIDLRKKGVDILCVPCANTFGSNARWQRLMQTRAFLNSCVIVRVNRTGEFMDNNGAWEFYGESFIALPDGSLGDMMSEKEGILISKIEKENLEKIKNLWQFR